MNNLILRTYLSETDYIDEPIKETPDRLENNQSVIDKKQLENKYWKTRWKRKTGRPGKVFYVEQRTV